MPAQAVQAPLIGECLADIECRVADTALAANYNLFVLEAVATSLNEICRACRTLHHNGDDTFTIDGRTLDLKAGMVQWTAFQVDL